MARFHWLLAGGVVSLVLLAAGVTQADPLDDTSRELTLKAQKLVHDIQFNFSQARALEKTNPQRARGILRQSKELLEDDIILPERQRKDLLHQVENRLRDVNVQIAVQKKADEIAGKLAADKSQREEKRREEERKNAQGGATAAAKGRFESAQAQLAAIDKLRAKREQGILGVLNSVEASAVPINGIVEFPSYWNRITELRKQKLHPKEIALLKALNSTLSVDFKNEPFQEVINYLQEKTGQAIILDENSLKEAMVETNDPVTFQVKKVTVRTILRKVLGDKGLAYVLSDGVIQVVTAQKAREMMVVRTYPVSDLVGADPNFYGPMTPFVIAQNAQNLINMIQTAIEPGMWQVNGGPGSITFFFPSRSLVVRASAEMHYMFGGTGLLER